MSFRHRVLVLAIIAAAVAAAIPVSATDWLVTMGDQFFIPDELTIIVGDKVIWNNTSRVQHTVTSGNPCTASGLFESGVLNPGQMFQYVFGVEGTYPYFCRIHCLVGMTGMIRVNMPIRTENRTWGAIKALYRTP